MPLAVHGVKVDAHEMSRDRGKPLQQGNCEGDPGLGIAASGIFGTTHHKALLPLDRVGELPDRIILGTALARLGVATAEDTSGLPGYRGLLGCKKHETRINPATLPN